MTERSDGDQGDAKLLDGEWTHVVSVLGENAHPVEVGQFEVGDEGRITRRSFDLPLEFNFVYDGGHFDCQVDLTKEQSVRLSSTVGRLPFTAESTEGRKHALRLLAAKGILSNGRLSLSDGGWIHYEGRKAPPRPCTPASVLASVAALVLELKPVLRLIRQSLEPAGCAASAS